MNRLWTPTGQEGSIVVRRVTISSLYPCGVGGLGSLGSGFDGEFQIIFPEVVVSGMLTLL